jgi:hypothetical protein
MQLKPDTEKALNAWLGSATWWTNKPLDMARFYDFVDQYLLDHGFSLEVAGLWKLICEKSNSFADEVGNGFLDEVIQNRIGLAIKILTYWQRMENQGANAHKNLSVIRAA